MPQPPAGGAETNTANCPINYPPAAPKSQCGHISFVEIDGMMAYKVRDHVI
jgi:hypothetical protein